MIKPEATVTKRRRERNQTGTHPHLDLEVDTQNCNEKRPSAKADFQIKSQKEEENPDVFRIIISRCHLDVEGLDAEVWILRVSMLRSGS